MTPPPVPRGHRAARRAIAAAVYVLAVALTLVLAAALVRAGADMVVRTWEYAAHRAR
ncbi:hypothetical protein ABZ249_20955 [Nocardiopsis sp. NPDC006139]|uniref:hypothetical protein n=1 Tax=Nocardiopsis sp. NPDC006139 TaxID=3154578 RepID=UPI0033BBA682